MDRAEWRQLAEVRVLDAEALLHAQRWAAAYYLAGYSVECGLKACVLAYVENHLGILFEDRRLSDKCFTHDAEVLVKLADLKTIRDAEAAVNRVFWANWQQIKDWNERARCLLKGEPEARGLDGAVTDHANGVLPWIKTHW